jgi:hypothetical protein
VGVQFLLSGVHNEPGIFFAFCTNRLRREISTPKASHDSFAVMNKGKRLTSTRRPSSQYVERKLDSFQWDGTVQLFGTKGQKILPCSRTKGHRDKLTILPWDGTGMDFDSLSPHSWTEMKEKVLKKSSSKSLQKSNSKHKCDHCDTSFISQKKSFPKPFIVESVG